MFFFSFLFLLLPPIYIISIYNNYISTLSWRDAICSEFDHKWIINN